MLYKTSSKIQPPSSLQIVSREASLRTQLTLQVCKTTSGSYETSSKMLTSSLQNERFVRDFTQKCHVQLSKTSISYETSPQSQAGSPIGVHIPALPSSFAIPAPPNNTRSHANPNVTATFTSILYHNSQPHDSLRPPRILPRPHV